MITVLYKDDFSCEDVDWPADDLDAECDPLPDETPLNWDAGACELIGWTLESDTFYFESDACKKIINEYTVIDWCVYDAYKSQNSYFYALWYEFSGNNSGSFGVAANGFGPSAGYSCNNENNILNNRFSPSGVFTYTQVIKINDDVAPEITGECDAMIGIHDNDCTTTVTLSNSAIDASDEDCPATWFKWKLYVLGAEDEDGDAVALPSNLVTEYDERGKDVTVTLYNTAGNAMVFDGPWLLLNVRWKVWDGCGNSTICDGEVMIIDKKPPTPYCVSLSSALMKKVGTVELWAKDFNVASEDNCFGMDLLFTFDQTRPVLSSVGTDHFFKKGEFVQPEANTGDYYVGVPATEEEYLAGEAQWWDASEGTAGYVFGCESLGTTDVKVSVHDGKLNTDFCVVELTLVDNLGGCGDETGRAAIAGQTMTEDDSPVGDVNVHLQSMQDAEFALTAATGTDGDFAFPSNPVLNSYEISAESNNDPKLGISTLDLVLIQRHILGIQEFTSPYNMIAADINNDLNVSATDLLGLRKLILGIYDELPSNDSWRFVDASQTLDVQTALDEFNEVISIASLETNLSDENFVAVKIGDVNGSAMDNVRGFTTRSNETINVSLAEQNVRAGDLVDLTFSSSDFDNVYGYQFTVEFDGMTFEAIEAGDINMTDVNVGILDENTLTVSYSGVDALTSSDNMFTVKARVLTDGTISEKVRLTSTAVNSEAYVGASLNINTVELTIEGEEVANFSLGQNEPNPFIDQTVIGFTLAEAGATVITVTDVAGKLISQKRGDFAKGYNTVTFTKNELSTVGVLYYTLESGSFTATRKMIIIE